MCNAEEPHGFKVFYAKELNNSSMSNTCTPDKATWFNPSGLDIPRSFSLFFFPTFFYFF